MATNTEAKVFVITGGNRGLGLGLVKSILARPHHTVITTVRSQEAAETLQKEIASVEKGEESVLHVVQIDFTEAVSPDNVRAAIDQFGIDHIDVLILNAGYAHPMRTARETTAEDLRAAFETNTIAPLLVFQGLWPLLQRSPSDPKLIWITSSVGSIGEMEPVPGGAYGPSRAAQNWLTRALHLENHKDGLIAIALHPGWVKTRMGQHVADEWPQFRKDKPNEPPLEVEDSVLAMLNIIDTATPEDSGKFINAAAKPEEPKVIAW
ncbi:hypothetical protein PFICI_05427 [Pestalotiopsis fici W106-1]|uniref:Uncharacterized protein n=1 Tax=Pestalotiopsis fici (strain W106-1 / CGMCC3.15140) TaxID=1229662 RepID=W3XEC3_PESFW|nr:uncharacterized protein PFICI_05427 [Pestalotiopsis fici W106-1]ETS83551.1 hypothetical protein PFICI_05427 [Pestalotiopsis fici W106-1]